MSSFKRRAEGSPRVFRSLRPAQVAFVARLMNAIASHSMKPVRMTAGRKSSSVPLEAVPQIMKTCQRPSTGESVCKGSPVLPTLDSGRDR